MFYEFCDEQKKKLKFMEHRDTHELEKLIIKVWYSSCPQCFDEMKPIFESYLDKLVDKVNILIDSLIFTDLKV